MFEFTKKFAVNDKLTFRLYPELVAESYTLLVKKIKDNLVAAVVSNNDKNSVNPSINDEIYLYSEANDRNWVTKTLVMQTNAYPLIILSIAEEPRALTPSLETKPRSLVGDIESTEQAHSPTISAGKSKTVATKETVKSDDDDDLTTMPSITIRELTAEHDRAQGQEGMRFGAEELDTLPDIDTSDLEAELDADIEDTLEKRLRSFTALPDTKNEAPSPEPLISGIVSEPEMEDDFSDMTIVKDRSLEMGDFEGDDEATVAVEEPAEQESLELDIDEPQGGLETLDEERLPADKVETEEETEEATTSEPEPFYDFFTAYLTPAGNGVSELYGGFDADVPMEVKLSLDALAKRIEKLEGALSSISGRPAEPVAKPAVRSAVIMAGLTEDGFKAVMDSAPMGGELFTVEIDRPWKPSLFLKATAVAESSYNLKDITLTRFRFEDINDEGLMAVRAYLDGRAGFFKSLADLFKD